ncbi:hypothetical protein [Aquabacterium sp.]|uniref:hypothetical protein n=1 Tax=Aquabacterium sp. TaxID=1872578 RepID=UPI0025C10AD0|nr:hypothetical protein [Aquabacterium sp.]
MNADAYTPTPADATARPVQWADTDIKTQVFGQHTETASAPPSDIGEAVGRHTRELFVSCDATQALQMQLDLTGLRFMVIGDLGGGLARRCLIDVARASGWPVQRLLIRRQGFGDTLASLLFLDSPTQDGRKVRVFCADAETDPETRQTLSQLLLARAELVALLVPELDPVLQAQAIDTLSAEVQMGEATRHNRHLIFLPTKTSPEMVGHIARFRMQTGIQARMAPAVKRADQVWVYLGSTWNQLQESVPADMALRLQTLALMPPAGPAPNRVESKVVPSQALLAQRCVHHLMRQAGVQRVCLFDLQTLSIHAHTGTDDEAQAMARQGRTLLSAMGRAGEEMALGHALAEASFTLMAHRVVLRGVAVLPGCVMSVVMARSAPALGPLPSRAALESPGADPS